MRRVHLALMLLMSSSMARSSEDYQCPPMYPSDGIKLTKIPNGWYGTVNPKWEAHSAGIFDGRPDKLGELAPTTNDPLRSVYKFLDKTHQHWLVCSYGYFGGIQLSKPLPAGVKTCTIKYRPDLVPKYVYVDHVSCTSG